MREQGDMARRSGVLSWVKIGAVVLPILVSILAATWTLSSNSSALTNDVEQLQEKQRKVDELLAAFNPAEHLFSGSAAGLKSVNLRVDGLQLEQARSNDAVIHVDKMLTVLVSSVEARLKRIEDKIDRLK